jgi:hypothetical protein
MYPSLLSQTARRFDSNPPNPTLLCYVLHTQTPNIQQHCPTVQTLDPKLQTQNAAKGGEPAGLSLEGHGGKGPRGKICTEGPLKPPISELHHFTN